MSQYRQTTTRLLSRLIVQPKVGSLDYVPILQHRRATNSDLIDYQSIADSLSGADRFLFSEMAAEKVECMNALEDAVNLLREVRETLRGMLSSGCINYEGKGYCLELCQHISQLLKMPACGERVRGAPMRFKKKSRTAKRSRKRRKSPRRKSKTAKRRRSTPKRGKKSRRKSRRRRRSGRKRSPLAGKKSHRIYNPSALEKRQMDLVWQLDYSLQKNNPKKYARLKKEYNANEKRLGY